MLDTETSQTLGCAAKDSAPGEFSSEQVKVQSHANDGDLTHTAPQIGSLNPSHLQCSSCCAAC